MAFGRSWLPAGVILATSIATLAAQPAASPKTEPQAKPQTPARARDSVYALNGARNALTVHHWRLFLQRARDAQPVPWPFLCEIRVDNYCFGPTNGGIPFGALTVVHPVEFRLSPLVTSKYMHRTYAGMTSYLMSELDRFQRKIPGDRWINGQRVFHLMQHGQIERSQKVARECRGDKWWCAALVGYTSYHLHQFQRADSAFNVALSAMPSLERCKWESIHDLIYGDPDRAWYVDLSCDEKKRIAATVWWLSDPLYLTPGNERLAAHYYREVSGHLFLQSNEEQPGATITPRRLSTKLNLGAEANTPPPNERGLWQSGALASLVRGVGVPTYMKGSGTEILFQYPQPTYHFVPTVAAIRDPLRATAASWNLEDSSATERYHPQFGSFTTLDHQIAWFRRGDRSRIVAAVDVDGNPLFSNSPRRGQLSTMAMFLTRSAGDIQVFRDTIPGTSTTYMSAVPPESTIVSVEHMVAGIGAGRVRLASGPPPMTAQRVQLSDLLLVKSSSNLPETLERAAADARPTTTISTNTALGVFWEVYGLANGDSVSYTMSAVEGVRSLAVNIGRFLGIGGDERSSSVRFTEVMSGDAATLAKNLALDISTLSRGSYRLRLEVTVPGQDTIRVERAITVERPR